MGVDKTLSISSYNVTYKDLFFQTFVGGVLLFNSTLCLFDVFPIELIVFFLIPSVVLLGWAKIKVDGSPESVVIESGVITFIKGRRILFQHAVNDIRTIDISTYYDEYGYKPSMMVLHFVGGGEVSCSYQFLNKRQLIELSSFVTVV